MLDDLNNYAKSIFRESVVKIYKKCLFTGVNKIECDAAHIVPVMVCEKCNLYYKYQKFNGLLLCKNLHITFDNFIWTFDVFDIKPVTNDKDMILICPIIKTNNNYLKYTIHNHKDQYVKIPIKSLPYLYLHYQIFLEVNFKKLKPNISDLYQVYIKTDKTYQKLLKKPKSIWHIINNNKFDEISTILDKKYDTHSIQSYLVLYRYQPFRNKRWIYIEDEENNIHIENYDNYIDLLKNP